MFLDTLHITKEIFEDREFGFNDFIINPLQTNAPFNFNTSSVIRLIKGECEHSREHSWLCRGKHLKGHYGNIGVLIWQFPIPWNSQRY